MRQVIFQSCELHSCLWSIVEELRQKSQQDGNDFEFVDLVDALTGKDKEWVFSTEMGDYVDADKIGHPYAVIWASYPLEADWFAKLTADGYEGKKILIHTDPLKRGCRSEHPNYSFLNTYSRS